MMEERELEGEISIAGDMKKKKRLQRNMPKYLNFKEIIS